MKIDYTQTNTPDEYRCSICGVSGVKLWREYNTFAPALFCATCASQEEEVSIEGMDADGMRIDQWGDRIDQIGNLVPAIPDEEDIGYWGYTSVPSAGIQWWKYLPTFSQR